MKMIKYIFLALLISSTICTTYETAFETEFKVTHIKEGDGQNFPKTGNQVKVHYTGTFPDSGKKFDSSVDRGEPFVFTLQQGQVIKCWDEVVSQMSKGEKIYVVCPYAKAYGDRGAGGVIPAKADIAFEIELISFE
jgi:FKBP-type peptidyl-prolyl cis-trans isomerase